ncbi:hypothetical protein [Streptomyces sp. DH24]|uniref:hypothetical protein n=1 Tax=Streptomyces sp. DH24 TaxID=3040123 RepID=UPI0024427614|nr:hypothetical protein [Streptomyces sp. DH24]MDG9721109.1 hypothetical protein [Streptomyces sp. DH24]
MSILMRAPRECASWFWDLEDYAPPGLRSALVAAARMAEVLRKHDLLEPRSLEWSWFIPGLGGAPASTRLHLLGAIDDEQVFQRVQGMRPVGYHEAVPGDILVVGNGVWLDGEGVPRREYQLVELSVSPEELGLSAEVAVHHDVWGPFDFRGEPHPEVYRQNAPRLAAALRELEAVLGVEAEPGQPTNFGRAVGYGVDEPVVVDGRGPDFVDQL